MGFRGLKDPSIYFRSMKVDTSGCTIHPITQKYVTSIENIVLLPPPHSQHVAPRAATGSLQIPSSTSFPLVKLGQIRYEPPASMFAKSQTDWPFGWSAKQAKRSNHDPA